MATTKGKTASELVRRIRRGGVEVTYLPVSTVAETVGLSPTTVGRWIRTSAVRSLAPLKGGPYRGWHYVAVADCALLKRTPIKDSLAAGISRVPASDLRAMEKWGAKAQEATRATANKAREVWDDYDLLTVMAEYTEGETLTVIAQHVERTYSAVSQAITRLRESGDLPAKQVEDDGWWERTRAILTEAEIAEIESGTTLVARPDVRVAKTNLTIAREARKAAAQVEAGKPTKKTTGWLSRLRGVVGGE